MFFKREGPFTLQQLADLCGAELCLRGHETSPVIEDVAPLDVAASAQVTFLDNRRYLDTLKTTQATACILSPEYKNFAPAGVHLLTSNNPYRAYALVAQAFYPRAGRIPAPVGINPQAMIDPSASIGDSCEIAAGVVIEADVTLGAHCVVGANSVITRAVEVGAGTVIGPNVSLEYCRIGANCQIHAGARIGARGFGFTMDPGGFLDIPQVGLVLVGDGVEVGANTTIDRGAGPNTVIGAGTRIDNQVQIGHNAKVGRNCVLVAQAAVAGSAELGDFVVMAAKAGVTGHVKVGTGTQIASKAGVMKSIPPGQKVGGHPAVPLQDWLRRQAFLDRMMKKQGKT